MGSVSLRFQSFQYVGSPLRAEASQTPHGHLWSERQAGPYQVSLLGSSGIALPCPYLQVTVQGQGDESHSKQYGNHPGLGDSDSCHNSISEAPRVPTGDTPSYNKGP